MVSINLTQKQLQEILEIFYKRGNEQLDIKTKEFVNEMIQNIQSHCSNNNVKTN